MVPALRGSRSLTTLGITDAQLFGLSTMHALGSLLVSLDQLRVLAMYKNGIGHDDFVQLAPYLQQCHQLQCLQLQESCLTSEGPSVASLASVLLSLPRLQKLHINGYGLDNLALESLSIGLEECSQLTVFHMGDLWISPTSSQLLPTICRLLYRLQKLERLVLSGGVLGSDALPAMQ